jgi:adenine-specific DNA-methyltransferase
MNISWLKSSWDADAEAVLHNGDCLDLLRMLPDASVDLVVTSPPYNIGKPYETRRSITAYALMQHTVISECVRVLVHGGSICWQVGNPMNRPGKSGGSKL